MRNHASSSRPVRIGLALLLLIGPWTGGGAWAQIPNPLAALKGAWKGVQGLSGEVWNKLKGVPGVEDIGDKAKSYVDKGVTIVSGIAKDGSAIVVKVAKGGVSYVEKTDPNGIVTIIKVTKSGTEKLYEGAKAGAPILREVGEGVIEVLREAAQGDLIGVGKEIVEAGKEIYREGKEVLLDDIESESATKEGEKAAAEGDRGNKGEAAPEAGKGGGDGPSDAFLARLRDIYFVDDEAAAAAIWKRFQTGNADIDYNARFSNAVIDYAHATGSIPAPGHVVPPNPSATRGTVIDPAGVQVRASPSGASAPRILAKGTAFEIVGQEGDWYKLSDGGWVPSLWIDVE